MGKHPEEIRVRIEGPRVLAEMGERTVVAVAPPDQDGPDSLPNPIELLLGALADCSGIYAKRFCETRDIDPAALGIRMLCEYDGKSGILAKVDFEIELPEDFPEKYREPLLRAMEMCTVKKYLLNPPASTCGP